MCATSLQVATGAGKCYARQQEGRRYFRGQDGAWGPVYHRKWAFQALKGAGRVDEGALKGACLSSEPVSHTGDYLDLHQRLSKCSLTLERPPRIFSLSVLDIVWAQLLWLELGCQVWVDISVLDICKEHNSRSFYEQQVPLNTMKPTSLWVLSCSINSCPCGGREL